MNCLAPIVLKSGITVPCGKCVNCLSDRRNEWTIRLAIHTEYSARMPLFLTLTYDEDHLPRVCPTWKDLGVYGSCTSSCIKFSRSRSCFPTLVRSDVSAFLKEYKRKYSLSNDVFTYFGCGEYGDPENSTVGIARPHYHLLFFGDEELYQLFDRDVDLAKQHVQDVWKKGHVDVRIAGYDGIHYVTKYCLKDDLNDYVGCVPSFTIASKGLGNAFFQSTQAAIFKHKLDMLKLHFQSIFENQPTVDFSNKYSVEMAVAYWQRYVPKFEIKLSDGRFVFLPRALRKRLVGSYQHFKDNPMWVYNMLRQLVSSIVYYEDNGDLDAVQEVSQSCQRALLRAQKIKQRLARKKAEKTKNVSLKPDIKL